MSRGGSLAQQLAPKTEAIFPAFMPQATSTTIATFNDSAHNNPDTDFDLGDTVYAQATVPGGSLANRRIAWIDPDGFIRKTTNVTTENAEDQFLLPTTQTSVVGNFTLNNVGTWRVNVISRTGARVAGTTFTVADPNNAIADLSIDKSVNPANSQVAAGSSGTFNISVANRGPSNAQGVQIVDTMPANTTFVSITQSPGAGFSCSESGGTVTCTKATFAKFTDASFILNYTVNAGTAAGTFLTNTVTISSTTTERNSADNSAKATASVASGGGGGNTGTCTLDCPENMSVNANTTQGGQEGAIVTFASPSSDGDCGSITTSPASGSFFPVGTTTVTSTSGLNGGSCTFTVTVFGSSPVAISCPTNQTVTAPDGTCEATVNVGTPTTTPSGLPVEGVRSDGQSLTDPYPAGTTTITWTATDENGNVASCTQTITVNGNSTGTPSITAPDDVTTTTGTTATAACGALVTDDQIGLPTITGNCSVNVQRTGVPAGNFFPVGTTTITWTATDSAGHTATDTQTVTVTDTAPPLIRLNGDDPDTDEVETQTLTIECASAFTDPGATAKDSCQGTVAVTATAIDPHAAGTQTITYTAHDSLGNTSTATRTVIVVDTTPPVITLNGADPLTVECHTTFTDPGATANDGCAGSFAATASGTVNTNVPGTYTVTYNATDPSGNHATPVTRTVNVVDTLAPVITVNGANPYTVECHTSFTDPGATAVDACSGPVAVTASGTVNVNVPGTYTITYSATDGTHPATATRTVNVVDTTAPTITLTGTTITLWPPNHKYTTVNLSTLVASASDSCDSGVDISDVVISKVTSDEIENGNGDGNTMNDIVIAANCKSVQLRSERDGSGDGRVYTIYFTVRDATGNTTTKTVKVTVPQNQGNGGAAVDSGPHYTVTSSCQ